MEQAELSRQQQWAETTTNLRDVVLVHCNLTTVGAHARLAQEAPCCSGGLIAGRLWRHWARWRYHIGESGEFELAKFAPSPPPTSAGVWAPFRRLGLSPREIKRRRRKHQAVSGSLDN